MSKNFKIDCWMSFPEIDLAHATNLNKTENCETIEMDLN